MFIGIDLGTSSTKAILLDRHGQALTSASAPLQVSRPHPLWSEQAPADWWSACNAAISTLVQQAAALGIPASDIEAIGLTGQMHGATLLDGDGQVLRPAILWNDGRAFAECAELESLVPQSRQITGNLMMPGFTAPKLKWVARHEPDIFARVAIVLLPKDYLRYQLTGDFATDLSDAAGTLWLDVARRDWSDEILAATGLTRAHMPKLYEGNQITGHLKPELAAQWGLRSVPVIAGASDNAAGAIGVGIVTPGQAMLSLGTSGVYFAASDGYHANPEGAVHSFCHALPHTWHLMSVMLSAAACLDFTAGLTGFADVAALLEAAERRSIDDQTPLFLPYLSGERTPHNNPEAQGVFFGLTGSTRAADLANATLEGVGLGLADGVDALESTGVVPTEVTVIGGGSRSAYWVQMLSDVLNRPLVCREGGEVGPALGAARLAHLALDPGTAIASICPVPPVRARYAPNPQRAAWFAAQRRPKFQQLYARVESLFHQNHPQAA
ncbi:xylulokinase [Amantichitinum ursilacus]|uniref:Xylulose kinase n=1 Tax=Amantichitinum ursilacus TaxID=857265 RepID=A0A0N0XIE0_9NEIS|nr:xylulokinase [Amantichitinum ursilacus]KPC52178.1 Xylulose kinase [Amantichitinum ursilacus]